MIGCNSHVLLKGCTSPDPTAEVVAIENDVQSTIDFIWRQMSLVDSIGRSNLESQCGSNRLEDLMSGARNLADLLTAIRLALVSATDSLACQRINPIYDQAVHRTACTNTASAAAYGFILFFVLSVSLMTIISLRAAWLRSIEELKVYHDEDEVVENMIVDEHEEYLAYISKYKHEWQEYGGIDKTALGQSQEEEPLEEDSAGSIYFYEGDPNTIHGGGASKTDDDGYSESQSYSDSEAPSEDSRRFSVDIFPTTFKLAPAAEENSGSGASISSADISFPSLSADESSVGVEDSPRMPSALSMPPPANPAFVWQRTEDEIEVDIPFETLIGSQPNTYQATTMRVRSAPPGYHIESKEKTSDPKETNTSVLDTSGEEDESEEQQVVPVPRVTQAGIKNHIEDKTEPPKVYRGSSYSSRNRIFFDKYSEASLETPVEGEIEVQLSKPQFRRGRSHSGLVGSEDKTREFGGIQRAASEDYGVQGRTVKNSVSFDVGLEESSSISHVKQQAIQYKPPSAEGRIKQTPGKPSKNKIKPLVDTFERATNPRFVA